MRSQFPRLAGEFGAVMTHVTKRTEPLRHAEAYSKKGAGWPSGLVAAERLGAGPLSRLLRQSGKSAWEWFERVFAC